MSTEQKAAPRHDSGEPDVENWSHTRESLVVIYNHPDITAATKLAIAMALDRLDAGDLDGALEIINDLIDRP